MFKFPELVGKNFYGKEVKEMNRILSVLMAIALVFSTSSSAFAAWGSIGSEPFTASASPAAGTPGVITGFSASLMNISGGSAASVTWPGVTAQNTDWKAAEQYIEVKGFATDSTWGIQIYTDNMAATADPKYAGTGNPAGLVETSGKATALPMSWRVVADKKFTTGSDDLKILQRYIAVDDIYVLLRLAGDYVADDDYFAPWGWILDKNTDSDPDTPGIQGFGNYSVYATTVGNYGIAVAPGDPTLSTPVGTYLPIPTKDSTYHIYLGAKFISAEAEKTYTTNKLIVEMYHL